MKVLYLLTLYSLTLTFAWAEEPAFYFSPENKKTGLDYYKRLIYRGCTKVKPQQETLTPDEMKDYTTQVMKLVQEDYSRAFAENPLVKAALDKDMEALAKDPSCQRLANDCRARLVSIPLFYYQRLRPDIPGCQSYESGKSMMSQQCEVELKYRTKELSSVRKNYGAYGISSYKDELIVVKNNTTLRTFQKVMYRDRENLHICEAGSKYKFQLNINDPGIYYENLNPQDDPRRYIPDDCKESKIALEKKFFQTDFDDRTTVGELQVEPIKKHIQSFMSSRPDYVVTDIEVVASSAKLPFYIKTPEGKKIIDPASDKRNIELAQERAIFARKLLLNLKKSSSDYRQVEMSFKAALAGPEFIPADLNERFVTRMTPGYIDRIEGLHKKYREEYENRAYTFSHELMDSKVYANIYQVKFKPFQGFRVTISGYDKNNLRCSDKSTSPKEASKASKQ